MKPTVLLITCEHAVNEIPPDYLDLFSEQLAILSSSKAYDIGAQRVARQLSERLTCDYNETRVSKLLIDCSASLTKLRCFSEQSKQLASAERKSLLTNYYYPYRQQTQSLIEQHIQQGQQVLHLGIHSFSADNPNAQIGLLYDSKRHGEREVSRILCRLLQQQNPECQVRFNYPFAGSHDNFLAILRKQYSEHDLLNIDLEINQTLLVNDKSSNQMIDLLEVSLRDLIQLL